MFMITLKKVYIHVHINSACTYRSKQINVVHCKLCMCLVLMPVSDNACMQCTEQDVEMHTCMHLCLLLIS